MKTKGAIALSFGVICVALGLIYGLSGQMQQSIPQRTDNIARWEKEIAKVDQEIAAAMAEVDKLGDKKDATPEEREAFAYKVTRVEGMVKNLGFERDMIEHERSQRKEQLLITAGLATLGVLAMLVGVLLMRRRRAV